MPGERQTRAADLFTSIEAGSVNVQPPRIFAAKDETEARRFLESREAVGKVLLV